MAHEIEPERVRDLLKINPKGLTIEEVSKKLSVNRATAAKHLNSLMLSGQADMRTLGPAKLFSPINRLPLTTMISLSSDMIIILDRDLFIAQVNDTVLTFFHLTTEDLKGVRIDQSPLAPYVSERYLATLHNAVEGKELCVETQLEVDKILHFFRVKILPLVFEEGEPAVGIIMEDITSMKEYQMLLEERVKERTRDLEMINAEFEENRHFTDQIVNTTPNLIYIYDTVEQKITYTNPSITKILGYAPEDLQKFDKDLFEHLLNQDDLHRIRQFRAQYGDKLDGKIHEIVFSMRHIDGHWVQFRSREVVFVRALDGHPNQIMGVAEEVREPQCADDSI